MLKSKPFESQFVICTTLPGTFWWESEPSEAGKFEVDYATRVDGIPRLRCSARCVAPAEVETAKPNSEYGVVKVVSKTSPDTVIWLAHINGKVVSGPEDTPQAAVERGRREALIREWQISGQGVISVDPDTPPEDVILHEWEFISALLDGGDVDEDDADLTED